MLRIAAPLLALLVALPSAPALARDITAEEGAALDKTVADFMTATKAADSNGILAVMPPPIISALAINNGLSVPQLKAAMSEQIKALAAGMSEDTFMMEVAAAEHRELADGTPYLVIPTTTIMDMGARGTKTARTPTLALLDRGDWYLVRVAEPAQVGLLVAAYPQFAGVEFPKASTETKSP